MTCCPVKVAAFGVLSLGNTVLGSTWFDEKGLAKADAEISSIKGLKNPAL